MAADTRKDDIVFEHEDDGTLGAFYLVDRGQRIGRLNYSRLGEGEYALDYVEVNRDRRGLGLAHRLIDEFSDFARDKNVRILPKCPVAAGMMRRDPKYSDVLAKR